jgi:hypothetical protein
MKNEEEQKMRMNYANYEKKKEMLTWKNFLAGHAGVHTPKLSLCLNSTIC